MNYNKAITLVTNTKELGLGQPPVLICHLPIPSSHYPNLQQVVSGPVVSSLPGNLIAMQILGPYHMPAKSETLGVEPGDQCFKKPSG